MPVSILLGVAVFPFPPKQQLIMVKLAHPTKPNASRVILLKKKKDYFYPFSWLNGRRGCHTHVFFFFVFLPQLKNAEGVFL